MALVQVNATVGTTYGLLYTVPTGVRNNVPVYIDNNDSAPIWLGDPGVTTSGTTIGIKVAAGGSRQLWLDGGDQIYAVSAAGTGAGQVVVTASV